MKFFKPLSFCVFMACGIAAYPCSRAVFANDSVVLVGRTLDWHSPIPTDIYVYPPGMAKQSMNVEPCLKWVSKYASVLAVSYDGGVTEGMNDKGLVMNGLFCHDAIYREAEGHVGTPIMSLAVIVSWFLDNFATVDEVAEWLDTSDFAISGQTFDGGTVSLLHWGLTDPSGTTLIIEYVNGELTYYVSKDYKVLTNDPTFPDMLAINDYWNNVGGTALLPGTVRSSDRFVRGSYFIEHIPTEGISPDVAVTELASVMDNLAVPQGYMVAGQPNLSSTQWRSISDTARLRYYFKFADSLGTFYIDLAALRMEVGAPVLKLSTTEHSDFFGLVNFRLTSAPAFTPMW